MVDFRAGRVLHLGFDLRLQTPDILQGLVSKQRRGGETSRVHPAKVGLARCDGDLRGDDPEIRRHLIQSGVFGGVGP